MLALIDLKIMRTAWKLCYVRGNLANNKLEESLEVEILNYINKSKYY